MAQVDDIITPGAATTRLGGVADEMLKLAGGREGLARRIYRGLCKAEGVDPDDPERRDNSTDVSAHRALSYHSMFVKMLSAADKIGIDQQRLDLSQQDLEAIAVQTALEWVQSNADFRRIMVAALIDADPSIGKQLIRMSEDVEAKRLEVSQ